MEAFVVVGSGLAAGTWAQVVAWWDPATGDMGVAIDAGPPGTGNTPDLLLPPDPLRVSEDSTGVAFSGLIDALSCGESASLTGVLAGLRTDLFDLGGGLA